MSQEICLNYCRLEPVKKGGGEHNHIKHCRELIDPGLSQEQTKNEGIYLTNYYQIIKIVF